MLCMDKMVPYCDMMEFIIARPGLWQNRAIFEKSFEPRKHFPRPMLTFILHRLTVHCASTCSEKGLGRNRFLDLFSGCVLERAHPDRHFFQIIVTNWTKMVFPTWWWVLSKSTPRKLTGNERFRKSMISAFQNTQNYLNPFIIEKVTNDFVSDFDAEKISLLLLGEQYTRL